MGKDIKVLHISIMPFKNMVGTILNIKYCFLSCRKKMQKNKEIEMIEKYNTRDSQYGYNITPGGEDNPWYGKHHSEESKKKMSEARKGVPKTEEWKRKISESNKGRVVTKETKAKMSKTMQMFLERIILCMEENFQMRRLLKWLKHQRPKKQLLK